MKEQKDVKGLYEYIISHLSEKGVKDLIKLLDNYTKGDEDSRYLFPTSILELAIRDEVQCTLENIEDERLVNMSVEKFSDIVDIIAHEIVYKQEDIWGHLNEVISWELEYALNDEELKESE